MWIDFDFIHLVDENENFIKESSWLDYIPRGWAMLFLCMCVDIDKLNPPEHFYFLDVKEKYGELRCLPVNSIDEIDTVIEKYRIMSANACMRCGRPRVPRSYLCEKCIGENKK